MNNITISDNIYNDILKKNILKKIGLLEKENNELKKLLYEIYDFLNCEMIPCNVLDFEKCTKGNKKIKNNCILSRLEKQIKELK